HGSPRGPELGKNPPRPADRPDQRRSDEAADRPFPGFVGGNGRRELSPPEILPSVVGERVTTPNDQEEKENGSRGGLGKRRKRQERGQGDQRHAEAGRRGAPKRRGGLETEKEGGDAREKGENDKEAQPVGPAANRQPPEQPRLQANRRLRECSNNEGASARRD